MWWCSMDLWQIDPLTWAEMPCIPIYQTWQIYWQIYIAKCTNTYGILMPLPLLQSIIGVWKTITPNKFIYSTIHIYPWQIEPTCLQASIDICKTITSNKFQIYNIQCTYIHGKLTPPIKHRCLQYHYTTLGTSHGRSIYI